MTTSGSGTSSTDFRNVEAEVDVEVKPVDALLADNGADALALGGTELERRAARLGRRLATTLADDLDDLLRARLDDDNLIAHNRVLVAPELGRDLDDLIGNALQNHAIGQSRADRYIDIDIDIGARSAAAN